MRSILAQWSIVVLYACVAMPAAFAFDATELMAMMARVEESSVAFEETKHVAVLTTPLTRRGTLHYTRPDRMEMRVADPHFERLTIAGERLAIETRKGKREIDLSAVPAAAAWIASLRATLSGDAAGLKRYFRIELEGSSSEWKLKLQPLERALADTVEGIEISGVETRITRISIDERQGDRTVLVLSPLRAGKP